MNTGTVSVNPAASPEPISDSTHQTRGAESEISKEMFLKLLVAQIRNQNPLRPADGIEFLSQLAEFSSLEQMMAIRSELEAIRQALEGSSGADSAAPEVPQEP